MCNQAPFTVLEGSLHRPAPVIVDERQPRRRVGGDGPAGERLFDVTVSRRQACRNEHELPAIENRLVSTFKITQLTLSFISSLLIKNLLDPPPLNGRLRENSLSNQQGEALYSRFTDLNLPNITFPIDGVGHRSSSRALYVLASQGVDE